MFESTPSYLDSYYTQAYEWGGQYTVANSQVSEQAIFAATETAANMLRYSPEIAARMAAANSRIAIIPGNETTEEIPELAHLDAHKSWQGTLEIPVTSLTENNALGLPFPLNSHWETNLTLYSFAYSIANFGLDDAAGQQLTLAYENAMSSGLWEDTWAATDKFVYFAEMSDAFFDHVRGPDAVKNHVNTREELETYDPAAFALMVEVYGNDSWRDGDWAGSIGSDNVQALGTNDYLFGGNSNDTLTGNGGNDTIDGGNGEDTAVYSGAYSDYIVFSTSAGTVVQDLQENRDGNDVIANIENLQFADQTVTLSDALAGTVDADNSPFQIYRFLNSETGTHFYTASIEERNALISGDASLTYQGNVFDSNATEAGGGAAVVRFFNTMTGTHFYTADTEEAANIRSNLPQFTEEGVEFFAHTSEGSGRTALFRYFNAENGSHLFTTSETGPETSITTVGQYSYEGIAYYVDGA